MLNVLLVFVLLFVGGLLVYVGVLLRLMGCGFVVLVTCLLVLFYYGDDCFCYVVFVVYCLCVFVISYVVLGLCCFCGFVCCLLIAIIVLLTLFLCWVFVVLFVACLLGLLYCSIWCLFFVLWFGVFVCLFNSVAYLWSVWYVV